MMDLMLSVVYYIIGANKFYREQLMCREQEPWLFRGGLLGEIQVPCVLMPVADSLSTFCLFSAILCIYSLILEI